MLRYAILIFLISLFVMPAINAETTKQNRRTKRLGPSGRNSTNKFKKEVWKQDVSDLFQIEPSTQGIQNVHLKCGANSMFVNLKTEKDFTGVMYTKGNFYDQSEPCFVATKPSRGTRTLTMRFSFDQCNTKNDGNLYTNVIVVQNDPELVTPGDAAFALQCDFRKPRGLNVGANYEANGRMASGARISLTSPDPSSNNAQPDTKHENTFYSETDTVTFNAQAHEHKLTEFHDASSVSITSNLIESFETDDVVDDIDESVTESSLNDKQNVKVTIDSVDPYASDEQDKHSLNAIDNDDESEIPIIYKNDEL